MKSFLTAVVATVFALPLFAQTSTQAVAVINVSKVVSESNAGKAAFERLKKMQDDRAAKAKAMDDELKSLDNQISQKKLSVSDEKLVELQKQFSDKKIALQRFAQDAERELTTARDRSLQELEKQLMPLISQIGKEKGYAAIFNKYESGLVFASEAVDITDLVIKRFNETASKPQQASTQR